ncbi:non-homologous end joining protein Ku [Actinorhabdospora filicis]|uniref:Non-homologous end joining protein Ku n=1 Tax=Actinorhabdospora filicis TaxID=1785913 RepID=A0A9W6SPD2_9ACTN|nr:Ku protein [Actinorhabdospora filicis]GLZ79711.1 non-homologous end joining protein Ku [Actinorhabdospora filicis]
MPRSMWKGSISFGLVTIAVEMYSATVDRDVRFHQVHRDDGGRIRYKRVCELDGEEVPYERIGKGFDVDGETVILEDADFESIPLAAKHVIDVVEFVPAAQIDPILYEKSYYLEPGKGAAKAYVLLREALARAERVAVVKVVMRQKEQLAVLRVHDELLMLGTIRWADEVRAPGFPVPEAEVRRQELQMAGSLIETMSADFDPADFTDDYREAVEKLIEAKVTGNETVPMPGTEEGAEIIDLREALKASMERLKKDTPAKKATAKKTARKAAKKAAPKRAS